MEIKSIKSMVTNNLIINKSKFITYIFPVQTEIEIKEILNNIKKEYLDATHVCFGYILYDSVLQYKAEDDNEPTNTAGLPILNVLKKSSLVNVLAIVIRYFGGIKLGAGGLIRAYSKSCSEALKKAHVSIKAKFPKYEITFDYSLIKLLDKYFETKKEIIIKKNYDIKVSYIVLMRSKIEELSEKFSNKLKIRFIDEEYMEI